MSTRTITHDALAALLKAHATTAASLDRGTQLITYNQLRNLADALHEGNLRVR